MIISLTKDFFIMFFLTLCLLYVVIPNQIILYVGGHYNHCTVLHESFWNNLVAYVNEELKQSSR